MAIGLGKMFGFHFLENFHFPVIARSISGFWRRWHLSLSTWFRDYLYIPLGGSRMKPARVALNMLIVWSLTGLWHGANGTFLVWGMLMGLLLILERFTGLGKWMDKRPIGHVYALGVILLVTVLMRADTMNNAIGYLQSMLGLSGSGFWDATATMFLREYGVFLALSAICSIPLMSMAEKKWRIPAAVSECVRGLAVLAVFAVSLSYVIMGSFSPFIYFNF
jgi:D-alanyl-lipoteichoic acid acyltransferase DltB (MBOAT superfamily)